MVAACSGQFLGLCTNPALCTNGTCGYAEAYPQGAVFTLLQACQHGLARRSSCWLPACTFCWQLADQLFLQILGLTGFCQNSQNRFTVKRIYTRIVVVVNTWHFLWTRAFFLTESGGYTFYKAVNDPVSGASQSWTRFWRVANNGFVHKSCLWISRRLSTGTGD